MLASRMRLVVVAAIVAAPTIAAAQPRPPGLTLPGGTVSATLTVELDASDGAFGEPTSIAPDLHYGATDDLTVSLVHSTFATTGFRGNAGRGVCITGGEHGCPNVYDNVGVEGLYSLVRGPFALAANAGVHAWSLDAGHHAAKLGLKLRYKTGAVTIASAPSIFVALTERDDDVAAQPDRLWLPVTAAYAVTPAASVGVGTGLKGPLDGFGDRHEVALGAFATYTISPALALGGSWVHGKIIGGDAAVAPGTSGLDFRAIHLWVTVTGG